MNSDQKHGAPQEKKPARAEGPATVREPPAAGPLPCALLVPRAEAASPGARRSGQPPATEDESADPVGDGHSDADLAARMAPATARPRKRD